MKKYLLIGLALLIGVIGCSIKETEDEITEPLTLVFQAAPFMDGDAPEDTKTAVIPDASYSSYGFIWSAKDTVGIFPDAGSQIYFTMASGAGASSAQFDGGAWTCKDGYEYWSYFPFIGNYYLNPAKIPVTFLGQKQVGNANSDHFQKYDYMYAPMTRKEDNFLNFSYQHLITGVLPWVDLPAGHYTGLTLSLEEALFVTKGEYDLTSTSPAISGKEYSNSLHIDLDITLTDPGTLIVYVPMAPIDMRGKTLTITVSDEGARSFEYTYNPGKAYVASNIYRLRSAKSFVNGTVSLDKTELPLYVGQSQQLTATVLPENAADKSVAWTSSNTDVATVDASGKVTAVAVGSATITATATQGGNTATCAVTVSPVEVTSVELNKTELALVKGASETLTATVLPENATDKTVTWSSSNTAIATVDATGKVTAVAGGSATVTAASGGKSATCAVTVTVPVSGVSLNKTSTDIFIGSTETLTATVTPADATNKAVSWTSDNTAVATVSSTGVVTAVAVGSANITVCTTDGNKTASCSVTVNPIAVTNIELNKSTLSLVKGNSETLTATVSPSNATSKSVTWTSSNTAVASVDTNGKVTAVGGGSATITASAGGKSAACEVTVTVPVTGISLNKSTTSIVVGNTETLTATVAPSDATNKAVTWTSSNTSVVTVDANGKVTAVAVGNATITVKTVDGDKTATCSVTVPVSVTGVSLNKTSTTIDVGKTETLTATVSPSNASNKSITWTSNNTSIATVSSAGVITAKAKGTATITATTVDGGYTATCTVSVRVPVTGVSLNKSSTTINVNSTETLVATVAPSNANNQSVSWSSDNTTVATVDSNGKVTAKAKGTATITVTTTDGNKTAECVVTVKVPVSNITLNKTTLSLLKNNTFTLSATITPSNASVQTVSWSSSNTSVATVTSAGVVTAKSAGNANITATADGKSATCAVTVTNEIVPTSISLSASSLLIAGTETETLTATILPANATNKTIQWSVDGSEVTITGSGATVTVSSPRGAGGLTSNYKRTVTARASNGLTATCEVTTILTRDYPFYYKATEDLGDIFYLTNASNQKVNTAYARLYDSNTKEGVLYCDQLPYYIDIYSQTSSQYRSKLTSVTIPSGGVVISAYAFKDCNNLSTVTLPSDLVGIYQSAFANCTSLTSISIPQGVTTLRESVFYGCTSLSTVSLPSELTSIGNRAFEGCSSLNSITLPSGLTSIGLGAFSYCTSLTTITIPESVTSFGDGVFDGCSNLTSFTINAISPDGKSIVVNNRLCFLLPSAITNHSYTVSSGITSLSIEILSSAQNITLPSSITSIEDCDFHWWDNLTLTIKATTPPTIDWNSDYGDYSLSDLNGKTLRIIVPKNSVNAYKTATNWSRWASYIEAGNNF